MKQVQRADVTASGIADLPAALSGYSAEVVKWVADMKKAEEDAKLPELNEPLWVDYGGDVGKYTTALETWQTEKNARQLPYPQPLVPPLVASLLNEDGTIMEHEVVEPVVETEPEPTPEEVFQLKRQELFIQVQNAQIAEEAKIVPMGKRRLIELRSQSIQRDDMKRIADLNAQIAENNSTGTELMSQIAAITKQEMELPEGEKLAPADVLARNKAQASLAVAQEKSQDLASKINNLDAYHKSLRPAEDQKFLDDQAALRVKLDAVDLWSAQATSDIEDLTPETIADFTLPPLTA